MPTSRTPSRKSSGQPRGETARTSGRPISRAATAARTEILAQLKEDHKRVKKAYRDSQKLDIEQDADGFQALVVRVLDELTLHATLEEGWLYPAARRALVDPDLLDEAEVEHASTRSLIEQLRSTGPHDDKYAARFKVLCEYVMHHVKEEEGEMFPLLESARLDWVTLAAEMNERRLALMPPPLGAPETPTEDEDADPVGPSSANGAIRPPTSGRAARGKGLGGGQGSSPRRA